MVASPRFTMRGKKTKGKTRRDALSSLGSMMCRKTALRASWTTPEHATYTSYPRHWHSLDWTPCNVDDERCHYSRHSSSLAFSIYERVAPRRCLDFWGGEGEGDMRRDAEARTLHHAWRCAPPIPSIPPSTVVVALAAAAAEACRFIFPGRRILAFFTWAAWLTPRGLDAGWRKPERGDLSLAVEVGLGGSTKDERIRGKGRRVEEKGFFLLRLRLGLWIGQDGDGVSGSGLAGRPQGGDGRRRFHPFGILSNGLGHTQNRCWVRAAWGGSPDFSADRGRQFFDNVPSAMATNDHVHVNSSASFFQRLASQEHPTAQAWPPAPLHPVRHTPGLLTWRWLTHPPASPTAARGLVLMLVWKRGRRWLVRGANRGAGWTPQHSCEHRRADLFF